MGSRIGFCTKDKTGKTSQIFRQQWATSIENGVTSLWENLGGDPDNGSQAIRDDLDNSRAFACLVYSFYQAPFNSIEENTSCDISDNGLITIDVSDYANWVILHQDIDWETDTAGKLTKIATMSKDGFQWLINQAKRGKLGEGLN